MMAEGFAHTATKQQVEGLEHRMGSLEQRFDVLERKVDRALYQEIDKHDRWIHQLVEKVGIQLAR